MMSDENGSHAARHAERAVVHVAAGAAGDLRQLGRRQVAMHLAVELARAGEGDMVDVQVEPHADGVGGDEKVDIARLIQRHLGVARARAQRTQHDGCTAALAPHQLGDGIDLGGGERDDRGARRQARDLLLARIGELRQPGPGDEIGAGDEVGDGLAHGLGAEQQASRAGPRTCSSRSVKTWPRSGSAASCTSSMARKSTSASRGIASTVHT